MSEDARKLALEEKEELAIIKRVVIF